MINHHWFFFLQGHCRTQDIAWVFAGTASQFGLGYPSSLIHISLCVSCSHLWGNKESCVGSSSFVISMCVALFFTIVLAFHYGSKQCFAALHFVLTLPFKPLEVLCHSAAELDMNHRSQILLGHSSTLQACCFVRNNEMCCFTEFHWMIV